MIRYERLTLCADFRFAIFCGAFYFHIADKFNIIDKPNERSSHASIVLERWWRYLFTGFMDMGFLFWILRRGFLWPLPSIGGVSFIDDVRGLPDSVRVWWPNSLPW